MIKMSIDLVQLIMESDEVDEVAPQSFCRTTDAFLSFYTTIWGKEMDIPESRSIGVSDVRRSRTSGDFNFMPTKYQVPPRSSSIHRCYTCPYLHQLSSRLLSVLLVLHIIIASRPAQKMSSTSSPAASQIVVGEHGPGGPRRAADS